MDEKIKEMLLANSRPVYNFCYHLTGNRMDADDLYQDTFLTAWEKREMFQDFMPEGYMRMGEWGDGGTDVFGEVNQNADMSGSSSQMKNYLLGIAAKLWKNRQRKIFRRNRITPFDDREDAIVDVVSQEPGPEGNFLHQEMLWEVRKQVEALPDKLRIVVVMYYTGEMSTEEIARRLQIPAATVRSRLSKARKKLQKRLEGIGYERLYG